MKSMLIGIRDFPEVFGKDLFFKPVKKQRRSTLPLRFGFINPENRIEIDITPLKVLLLPS